MRTYDSEGHQLCSVRRLPLGWQIAKGDDATTLERVYFYVRDSLVTVVFASLLVAIMVSA